MPVTEGRDAHKTSWLRSCVRSSFMAHLHLQQHYTKAKTQGSMGAHVIKPRQEAAHADRVRRAHRRDHCESGQRGEAGVALVGVSQAASACGSRAPSAGLR